MSQLAGPEQPSQEAQPNQVEEHTSRVRIRVEAPPGVRVRIIIEKDGNPARPDDQVEAIIEATGTVEVLSGSESALQPLVALFQGRKVGLKDRFGAAARNVWHYALEKVNWEVALVLAALLVYLLIRVVRLPDFPIFFFTDEAVNTVDAADFVRDGFRGYDRQFFPTFFQNDQHYNLSTSVYAQVIPYLLFGKSVWVTRGTSALLSLLAGAAVGLMFLKVYKRPYAWAAVLILSATPVWFLHSRTAFEYPMLVTFYACFLYFYLSYRNGKPNQLYPALIMGALAFYSYAPGQVVVVATGLGLLIVDFRYHLQNRATTLRGLGLLVVLALPLVRFLLTHPNENVHHLAVLNSYWLRDLPPLEKARLYAREYLSGLYPLYWYVPDNGGLVRHVMKGYGYLLWYTLPFSALGMLVSLRNIRKPIYRVPLIALLAAPTGAALVKIGVTRALVIVIPAAILTGLGLSVALEWLERRMRLSRLVVTIPLLIGMLGINFNMLKDALLNGPLWYNNYGLSGMQYGANQIFREIDAYLAENPGAKLLFSPAWTNGADNVVRFFYPGDPPFKISSIGEYFNEHLPLDDTMVFVMTVQEYQQVIESRKFTGVLVDRVVPYPDGSPGFYFTRLNYISSIDAILDQERKQRKILQQADVTIANKPAQVSYSFLDMGSIDQLFDRDEDTLVRTMEANPFVLGVIFQQPLMVSGLDVKIGGTPTRLLVSMKDSQGTVVWGDETTVEGNPAPRTISLSAPQAVAASTVLVEVRSLDAEEPTHVHVWEVTFR